MTVREAFREHFEWSMVPKVIFGCMLFFYAIKGGLLFGKAVIEPAVIEMRENLR